MAKPISLYNVTLNTITKDATSQSDIVEKKGIIVQFNDCSSFGFLGKPGNITHLLFGEFVVNYGISIRCINLNNPSEGVSYYDAGTLELDGFDYFGLYGKINPENSQKEEVGYLHTYFESNYEQEFSEVSKIIEDATNSLKISHPNLFNYVNKTLSEANKKYCLLFSEIVPKIREMGNPAPYIFEAIEPYY